MRWRGAATTSRSSSGRTRAPVPRDPFAFYGLPRRSTPADRHRSPASRAAQRGALRFLLDALRRVRRAAGRASSTRATSGVAVVAAAAARRSPSARRLRVARHCAGRSPPRCRRCSASRSSRRRRASCSGSIGASGASGRARRPTSRSRARSPTNSRRGTARGRTSSSCPMARAPGATDACTTVRRDSQPVVAGYAGHLYPWKGVDVFVRALALRAGRPRAHRRRPSGRSRRAARTGARSQRSGLGDRHHDHGPRAAGRGRARGSAARDDAGPAEYRVGDLRALHVAAEAVRVPDARPADRRVGSAGDSRGADRRADGAARAAGRSGGARARAVDASRPMRALGGRAGRGRARARAAITPGTRAPQRLEAALEAARAR